MTEQELAKMLRNNPDLVALDDMGQRLVKAMKESSVSMAQAVEGHFPKRQSLEHDLQVAVIAECDRRALLNPLWGLIFAIPNGGQRSKAQGGKLKAEGVRAGIPDLMIPVARHGYHGLFIELKIGDNKPPKEQLQMIDRLRTQGYYATVIWDSPSSVLNIIEWYLEGE